MGITFTRAEIDTLIHWVEKRFGKPKFTTYGIPGVVIYQPPPPSAIPKGVSGEICGQFTFGDIGARRSIKYPALPVFLELAIPSVSWSRTALFLAECYGPLNSWSFPGASHLGRLPTMGSVPRSPCEAVLSVPTGTPAVFREALPGWYVFARQLAAFVDAVRLLFQLSKSGSLQKERQEKDAVIAKVRRLVRAAGASDDYAKRLTLSSSEMYLQVMARIMSDLILRQYQRARVVVRQPTNEIALSVCSECLGERLVEECFTLLEVLALEAEMATCSLCGEQYKVNRKPKLGQNNYCGADCRRKGVRLRVALCRQKKRTQNEEQSGA